MPSRAVARIQNRSSALFGKISDLFPLCGANFFSETGLIIHLLTTVIREMLEPMPSLA